MMYPNTINNTGDDFYCFINNELFVNDKLQVAYGSFDVSVLSKPYPQAICDCFVRWLTDKLQFYAQHNGLHLSFKPNFKFAAVVIGIRLHVRFMVTLDNIDVINPDTFKIFIDNSWLAVLNAEYLSNYSCYSYLLDTNSNNFEFVQCQIFDQITLDNEGYIYSLF